MHPLPLLLLLASPPPDRDPAWQVAQVRTWLAGPRGPTHVEAEDPAPPGPGATELLPGSPGYREVVGLVSRGCALSTEGPPAEPRGHLWEVDLDGDGVPERVFSGGCSPAPYHVALRRTAAGWAAWHAGPGWLLAAVPRGPGVTFVSARDGYGVARESELRLESVDPGGAVLASSTFQVVGEQPASSAPAPGEACRLYRPARLRSGPRVDDTPQESGLGFDFPGNTLQALATGARGLALGARGPWRLCAFAVPAAGTLRAMLTPARTLDAPGATPLLVGWVPAAALAAGR